MKQKDLVDIEIRNFILFLTSDEEERKDFNIVADEYMKNAFEEHT